MKSFRDWMSRKFKRSELKDMVNYGVAGGFLGLIYYDETTALYRKFKEEIWTMLHEDADDQGVNILELICSFREASHIDSHEQFANLLVWYAAERIARDIIENGTGSKQQ